MCVPDVGFSNYLLKFKQKKDNISVLISEIYSPELVEKQLRNLEFKENNKDYINAIKKYIDEFMPGGKEVEESSFESLIQAEEDLALNYMDGCHAVIINKPENPCKYTHLVERHFKGKNFKNLLIVDEKNDLISLIIDFYNGQINKFKTSKMDN